MDMEIRAENLALFQARPDEWALLLVVDRLERPLEEMIASLRGLEPVQASWAVGIFESEALFRVQFKALLASSEAIKRRLDRDLRRACGPATKNHDPEKIDAACQSILAACNDFASAERALLRTPVNPVFLALQAAVGGLSEDNLGEVLRAVRVIRKLLEEGATGHYKVTVVFRADRLLADVREANEMPTNTALIPPPYPACRKSARNLLTTLAWYSVTIPVFWLLMAIAFLNFLLHR